MCFSYHTEAIDKAIQLAKRQLTALVTQVQTFLDMHQIISAGPFLYVFVNEVSTSSYMCKPRLACCTGQ